MSRRRKLKIKNNILATAAAIASAVCFLASCESSTIYHSFSHTDSSGWYKGDSIEIIAAPLRYEGNCTSYLVVRTDKHYPYKNLSVNITGCSEGNTFSRQIDFDLNSEYFKSTRHIGYIMPIRQLQVSKDDTLRLKISHNMTDSILMGITDVGIRIEKR